MPDGGSNAAGNRDGVMAMENTNAVQTSTPLREGGPPSRAIATPDGWNVNVLFTDGDQTRTYVFGADHAEQFIKAMESALLEARSAGRP